MFPLSNSKKNTFFGGAAVLAVSSIIVKLIGAIYKIPLGNVLTDAAYADFNSAYNIYNFFLTISTAGLPVALSKTISEDRALGRENQVRRTFRVALMAFLTMGLISFFCMSVLAGPLAEVVVSNPKAVYCIMALSPSVLAVCVMSALRGYFQGHFNMVPTGVSQIIEAFFKLVVGLGLAMFIASLALQPADFGEQMAAVGAIIGVSAGSVFALGYMLVAYFRARRRNATRSSDVPDQSKTILARLLKLAIPITLGSASTAIVTLIDNKLVMSQLQSVFQTVQGMTDSAALDTARDLYGIYGKSMAVYNLPFSLMVPLTACIVPAVSACRARRDLLGGQKVSESALRIGILLALPMGVGLVVLGGPIMALLYPELDNAIAGPLMSVLGLASIFVSIQVLCNAILQANNMVNLPVLVVVIGGVVKIIVNYVLVGNPDILINGAPVGTLCCFVIVSALELLIIRRAIPAPPRFSRVFPKPVIASVVMGAAVWAVHGLLADILQLGNTLSTLGSICVGVLVYLALVLLLRAISKEDLDLMPKGDKIAKILHIR